MTIVLYISLNYQKVINDLKSAFVVVYVLRIKNFWIEGGEALFLHTI